METISGIDFDSIVMNIRKGIYERIGFGSGRLVFDLKNNYVVKVAKNKRGIAQNIEEYQISSIDQSDFFAKIIAASENFDMIIMEKALKYSNFGEIQKYFHVKNNRELFQKQDIRKVMQDHHLVPQDLYRLDSWGMVRGRPVIIDYGFTWKVKRKYYFPFWNNKWHWEFQSAFCSLSNSTIKIFNKKHILDTNIGYTLFTGLLIIYNLIRL